MTRSSLKTFIALFVVSVLAAIPASAQCICDLSDQQFRGSLFGNQFTEGTLSPVGFGVFDGRFNTEMDTVTFDVRTRGLDLEEGLTTFSLVRNSDGEIVSTLDAVDEGNGNFSLSADLDDALMREIRRNPADFNLRIGTIGFPNGAIEGPIMMNRRFTGTFAGSANTSLTTEFRTDAEGNLVGDFNLLSDDVENIDSIQFVNRETGETVDFFDESGTLIDGELFGEEIQIDGIAGDDILENPDDWETVVTTADVEGGELRARFTTANDLFIPVVGSTEGSLGSSWDTDLRIFNTSWEDAGTATLTFYPRGGMMEPVSTTVSLDARETLMWDRTMAQLFPDTTGIGALRISSDAELVASARVFNDQRDSGAGTFGQRIDALTVCDAMTRGVLTGITDSEGTATASFAARTNVGMFNPSSVPVQVDLMLVGSDGEMIESRTVTLAAWMHTQVNLTGETGWFDINQDIVNGTLSFEASSPIFVYGSVVDNDSGDPSTLTPTADFGVMMN